MRRTSNPLSAETGHRTWACAYNFARLIWIRPDIVPPRDFDTIRCKTSIVTYEHMSASQTACKSSGRDCYALSMPRTRGTLKRMSKVIVRRDAAKRDVTPLVQSVPISHYMTCCRHISDNREALKQQPVGAGRLCLAEFPGDGEQRARDRHLTHRESEGLKGGPTASHAASHILIVKAPPTHRIRHLKTE